MRDKKAQKKRILVVNPYGIGDLIFATPLLRDLKFYYPESEITVLVAERNVPVLENNPNVDSVIPFSRGDFKELRRKSKWKACLKLLRISGKIRASRFNLYIDLSLDYRYSLLTKLLGVKPRLGYNYKNRGRFLTYKIDIDGYEQKHVVEYYSGLLNLLELKPRFRNPEIFISESEKRQAERFLREHNVEEGRILVALAPGGGKTWGESARYKYWPREKFAGLFKRLPSDEIKIVLIGDSSDMSFCDDLFNLSEAKAVNLCGKTSLRQFFSLLDKSDLVICNDGGVLHAATALDKKIVALFGPSDEKVYGPYPPSGKRIVISKDFPCRPCYHRFRVPECSYDNRCLRQIEVDEVLHGVSVLLGEDF